MGTFIIFWAALFAIICFVMGTIFKALGSIFNALQSSIEFIFKILFFTAAGIIALFLLLAIIQGFIQGKLWEIIGYILLLGITIGISVFILSPLGYLISDLFYELTYIVIDFIDSIINWAVKLFERGYSRSLKRIIKQLEKC